MGIENLRHIFNPKRIAVIGASERPDSFGARIFRNLFGTYQSNVYPVNPFRQTIQGIIAYSNISKVPEKVDLAIIATPAHIVPQIVEECGKAGVSGAIITSAGFREKDDEGQTLEQRILEHRQNYGIRIIGPNSFGIIRPRNNLYATFNQKVALPGKIAFISQSAALCNEALDWASETNTGFSAVVSTGSMLDVDIGDLIDFFGTDPQTRSIVLYVEFINNARKFMSAARGFARSKPIIVVKSGRFQESKALTLAHSGSLAGQDSVYDAAFRRVGVVRVEGIEDLLNCAQALSMQPNPTGPNLIIVTNAGGPAIIATDHLVADGGKLSPLSEPSYQALRRILPRYCSLANPLDLFEDATPERFRKAIEICLNDPDSNGTLIIYTPQEITDQSAFAQIVAEVARQTTKTLIVALTGESSGSWAARKFLQKNGIPAFRTPEEAISTFMHMWSYTQNLELLYQTPGELPLDRFASTHLKDVLRQSYSRGQKVLSLPESIRFLEAYQIPTLRTVVAKTSDEAVQVCDDLGFPVVIKALSPQFTHKSEVDGVVLNVGSPSQVPLVFNKLSEKIKKSSVDADFQGVAIQRMLTKRSHEIYIGSKKDPQFGSTILFGMGGTSVELLKDTSIGFPPLNRVLARRLMETTAIFRHISSDSHSFGIEPLEEILVKFSQLIVDFPEIEAFDINPLIIDESGPVAVDARVVVDTGRIMHEVAEHNHSHLVIAPYPTKYMAPRKLKDESQVLLRPIKPEDENRFNELFKSLSEETMRFRFFEIIKELSHDTLSRYCNIDYDREVAIVAELQRGEPRIIGVVRLILEPDGKSGEFAILVGDEWQGLGLGSRLMDSIIDVGRDMRIEKIFGYVIANNYKMLQLCNKKGFKVESWDEETAKTSLTLS